MKKLGETYPKISNSQNAELRLRWGHIVLKNDYQEDFWKVKEFLQSQVGNPELLDPFRLTQWAAPPVRHSPVGGGEGRGPHSAVVFLSVAREGIAMAGRSLQGWKHFADDLVRPEGPRLVRANPTLGRRVKQALRAGLGERGPRTREVSGG